LGELIDRRNTPDGFELNAQQLADGRGFGRRDQDCGPRIAKNAGLAAQMLLDTGQPGRRVNRCRYAASIQHAEEGGEEGLSRWQHEGNPLAGLEAANEQVAGNGTRAFPELFVGDRSFAAVARQQNYVRAPTMVAYVPIEHFGNGRHCLWRRLGRLGRRRAGREVGGCCRVGFRVSQRGQ
jgi:hypothetical protein